MLNDISTVDSIRHNIRIQFNSTSYQEGHAAEIDLCIDLTL